MKAIIYPAIFHRTEHGGFWVEFPDLPGCLTEADTIEEALLMAGDALFVWCDGLQDYPVPSDITAVKCDDGDIVLLVKAEPYESRESSVYRIAEEVQNGLETKKLNKSQVAQILDIDRSYLTHIISGKKTPSPEMAKRIGLLLGFDWHIFYNDTV